MPKVTAIDENDIIRDPHICGEYIIKPGMSMVKRCVDFYHEMLLKFPGKFIAANVVHKHINSLSRMVDNRSEDAARIRGWNSAARKESIKRYKRSIISLAGIGARMSTGYEDELVNSAPKVYSRAESAIKGVQLQNSIIDISKIKVTKENEPYIATFNASNAIASSSVVLKNLEALRYVAPKDETDDKKKK
jgi:hypothetical protein